MHVDLYILAIFQLRSIIKTNTLQILYFFKDIEKRFNLLFKKS